MKARFFFPALAASLMLPLLAQAQTIYIYDSPRVDMRSGAGTEYRILDFLKSGTSMEKLQESGDWVQVRVGEKEGWVKAEYVAAEPVARDQLERALKEIARLKSDNANINDQLKSSNSELNTTKSNYEKASGSATDLQKELNRVANLSRNHIATDAAYRQLQEDTELLKVDLEKLKVENARLVDDKRLEGIKWGAGAVLLGMLLTWLISKSAGKKRRSEW
ncbi:MAG TPA: TIGR04211 family SH3 domain-containing protein [Dongiaceae bacterium]|nr:TIGR04211 family SH3 domain-containing protein [Dongiaceae bacterium]